MNETLEIGKRRVGSNERPFLIAEVAQSHDGSVNFAHAFIAAASKAGADAIKFQTHIADAETTQAEPWRVKFSRSDESRYDYWRRMEFTAEQWAGLAEDAQSRGLIFLSSPFSSAAVDLLERLPMPAWKVASGEVSNLPLLSRLLTTKKPVLLSSGLSDWEELDDAVSVLREGHIPYAVLQCTTAYPCPPEQIGLNLLAELRARYGCAIGLSDHSATTHAGIAAAALGASIIEVHVTFHPFMFGPDVPASLTFEQLAQLRAGLDFVHLAQAARIDKNAEKTRLAPLRRIFTKSIYTAGKLPAGHKLTMTDLAFKKPGTGIPVARYTSVLGRRLREDLPAEHMLREEDLT